MPIYEFTCSECGHEHEELVKMGNKTHPCPSCGATSHQVFRTPFGIDWGAMGGSRFAGPEFIDRFERVHKEEAKRELKREED